MLIMGVIVSIVIVCVLTCFLMMHNNDRIYKKPTASCLMAVFLFTTCAVYCVVTDEAQPEYDYVSGIVKNVDVVFGGISDKVTVNFADDGNFTACHKNGSELLNLEYGEPYLFQIHSAEITEYWKIDTGWNVTISGGGR